MSYGRDGALEIWVGDLDGYVSISAEPEYDDDFLTQSTGVRGCELPGGGRITDEFLKKRYISEGYWKRQVKEANRRLDAARSSGDLEKVFVALLLEPGRRFALSRYAKLEDISPQTAFAASTPAGLTALLHQFSATQPGLTGPENRQRLSRSLQGILAPKGSFSEPFKAYQHTRVLRDLICDLAAHNTGRRNGAGLNREGLRQLLSACRVHFLLKDLPNGGIEDLKIYVSKSEATCRELRQMPPPDLPTGLRRVRNWHHRHLENLLYYYPYDIRNIVKKICLAPDQQWLSICSDQAAHALALSACVKLPIYHRYREVKHRSNE